MPVSGRSEWSSWSRECPGVLTPGALVSPFPITLSQERLLAGSLALRDSRVCCRVRPCHQPRHDPEEHDAHDEKAETGEKVACRPKEQAAEDFRRPHRSPCSRRDLLVPATMNGHAWCWPRPCSLPGSGRRSSRSRAHDRLLPLAQPEPRPCALPHRDEQALHEPDRPLCVALAFPRPLSSSRSAVTSGLGPPLR
jgi:hypothetical protein